MKHVYESNSPMVQQNMKTLLTYISELDDQDCKHYVYTLIKNFAIKNNDMYIGSNLLDLMNRIYQEERGNTYKV